MSTSDNISEARQRIESAYNPELFRRTGSRLVELLTKHLAEVEASAGQVLPWRPPSENLREALAFLDQPTGTKAGLNAISEHFSRLVQTILTHGHNLHDPRYIGHQVPASLPLAGLFDAVGAVTNQPMAVYEMGPWATAAELAMINCLGQQIGWAPGGFSGLATHGGSLANLTALLTARNLSLRESWEKGMAQAQSPALLLLHADAHYSVARAAGVLGLGTSHVMRVGLDRQRRMDPKQLETMLKNAAAQRQPVTAVVACACSTPVGAFDPLDDIAEVCQRHGVWLHVDAAHGGAACLSPRYRHLVSGLERADSIVWDAHKMLFMPALCAFVFYRQKAHAYEAFRQDAPYLFDPAAPGLAEFDSGLRTLECTKRAAVFGLWGVWSLFGQQLFTDLVDVTFAMGRTFYEKLTAAPDFVALHEPQCNIVVFRHVPESLRHQPQEVIGRFQLEVRRRLIESGEFYIVSTKIDGIGAMRTTIINPLTKPEHLDGLMEAIRRISQQLLK